MSLEILQDLKSNGKPRPWCEKKSQNLNLAASYQRIVDVKNKDEELQSVIDEWQMRIAKYVPEVVDCSRTLFFHEDGRFAKAYFCRKRLCAMCNWRKSLKVFANVSKVMDVIEREYPEIQPVFLTLTQRNCAFNDLEAEIRRMIAGFRLFYNNDKFAKRLFGWFRALEINYNRKTNTWHPHFHLILLLPPEYFDRDKKLYMQLDDWIKLWRLSMRLDYDPSVKINAIAPTARNKRKAVAEVAKYPLKDKEVFTANLELTDALVETLTKALYRKRLFAFGGEMAKIAKRLKLDKPEDGDLVKIDENEEIRGDVAEVLKVYQWNFGLMDFLRKR